MTDASRQVVECGQSAFLVDAADATGQCPGCGLPVERPSHDIGGRLLTDGGTCDCDECGDETAVSMRWRYLPPGQPEDGEVESKDLCPVCSTDKPSQRLFRAAEDQRGDSDV